jgi:hypothetical protein
VAVAAVAVLAIQRGQARRQDQPNKEAA